MPRQKLTDEQKAERKAIREIDKLIEEESKKKEGALTKEEKKDQKKYGKRVHVLSERVIHCRGTFIEEVLGGLPGDKQVFSTYVASKAPDAKTMTEEIELYGEEDVEMQQTTVFPRDKDGDICILNYQFRGFFKSAAKALKRAGLLEVTAHEKVINDLIKVSAKPDRRRMDRWIKLIPPKGATTYLRQRPIRGNTPQGERSALASSEALPAGTTFEFYVHLLSKKIAGATLSWMEFGMLTGLLQWRNSGCGRFEVEVEEDGEWIPLEDAE